MTLPTLLIDAARRLWRRPAQSLLTVGVLGLGLGATLFLAAVINGVLLQPLPFPERDRLVALGELRESGVGGISGDDYLLLRAELTRFDRFGTYDEATANISRGGGQLPKRYEGAFLGDSAATLVGLTPLLGRGFTAADDQPGAPAVLLLGETVWRSDFGADPGVIGQVLRVNGEAATVVGVLPADFRFPFIAEVWMPRRLTAGEDYSVQVVARLAPEVTLSEARAEVEAVVSRLGTGLEAVREERPLGLKPLSLRFVNEYTRQHVGMMVLPGLLVLMLACLNAANLRLGEAMGRQSELAVRAALGAGRRRMLQELLAETLWLALAATVVGLAIAESGCRWLTATLLAADDAPAYFIRLGVDGQLLLIAAGIALLTTLLAGLWPAWRASQQAMAHSLRASRDRGGAGRMLQALVVAEIAFTVILLVGAGTFLRGMDRVLAFDFGTRAPPTEVLTGRIGLREDRYAEPAARSAFHRQLTEALAAEPGVRAASAATALPGTAAGGSAAVAIPGELPPAGAPRALLAHVDPGFAAVYDLRLREGRFIEARDDTSAAPIAVIDTRTAAQLWPRGQALGQTLVLNPRDTEPERYTVVGVVDALHLEDADDPVHPTVLLSLAQHPAEFFTIALRTHGDAAAYGPRLAETLRRLDADLPVYWLRTQQQAIEMGRIGPLVMTQMLSAVGTLGLVLAATGIYGVLTQAVLARRQEIGVRRAVGAGSTAVVRLVAGSIGRQLAIGLGLGLLIALPWTHTLQSELFQTRAGEPSVLLGSLVVVLLATALAVSGPLRRALKVDPLVALRAE